MQFNKSYRLLRYLNRHHSAFSRHLLGGLAWLGAWLFTQSVVLAGLMRRDFIRDDFRLAFRRAAWFAPIFSRSWTSSKIRFLTSQWKQTLHNRIGWSAL